MRAAGWQARALARRGTAAVERMGALPVPGALEDEASLDELCRGAEVVVHLAGAIHAADRASFLAANVTGVARVAAAASRQGCRRLIHVSSLAAREPAISAYGESKALSEQEAFRHGGSLEVIVVRPPAIYGPGDRATLPIMQSLARGWLVAPRGGGHRFSLLFVQDLASLLVRLLQAELAPGTVLEPDDGRPGGYRWADLARLAEPQLRRKVRVIGLPRGLLAAVALLAERRAVGGGGYPLLSRAKVAELFHLDWVCDQGTMAAVSGWTPQTDFARGLEQALAWYREAGWLGGQRERSRTS
jgi:nucleoside-diphosphate-sugar epimerase